MARSSAKAVAAPQPTPLMRDWPADAVERWPIDKIQPYPRNPMLHSDEQVEQIAASMREFGVTTPVLVDEDGVLIFGHGRLLAAKKLGFESIPVSVARGWPAEKKSAYRIADNQLSRTAEWDLPALSAELKDLEIAGFDLPVLAFSEAMLMQLSLEGDSAQAAAQWKGMPQFASTDQMPHRSIIVHFKNDDDVASFAELVQQKITSETKYIWHPHLSPVKVSDKRYK